MLTGICFWQWAIVDATLIFVVWRMSSADFPQGWRARVATLVVSSILIVGAHFSERSTSLNWYDTEFMQMYRIELIGSSGKTYRIGAYDFKPYSTPFAQNRFLFLDNTPTLVGNNMGHSHGHTHSKAITQAIHQATSIEDVHELFKEKGRINTDAKRTARFDRFMTRYFTTRNKYGGNPWSALDWISSPHSIYNWEPQGETPLYTDQEPVSQVRVRLYHSFRRTERIEQRDMGIIHVVNIP
jgi:hypothetical protein